MIVRDNSLKNFVEKEKVIACVKLRLSKFFVSLFLMDTNMSKPSGKDPMERGKLNK